MWNVENGRRTALGRLLRPYLLEEFGARYYEHEPLHVERSDESYYSPYFTLGDLEDMLYGGAEIRSENCQAFKRGIPARPESYARYGSRAANRRRGGWTGPIDPDRISALIAHGYSLVVDDVQSYSAKARRLCCELEAVFGHPVSAKVYLTAPADEAVRAHYECNDIFVLQIDGATRWKIYRQEEDFPVTQSPAGNGGAFAISSEFDGDQLIAEILLSPGDLLYVPRGFVHQAAAADELSLHVTVALHPVMWIDVALEAVKHACLEDSALRRSVENVTGVDYADAQVHAALQKAISAQALKKAKASLDSRFLSESPNVLTGQLRQIRALHALDRDSFVALREPMLYRMEHDGDRVLVAFSNKVLNLPETARSIIEELAGTRVMRAEALRKHGKDALDILRRLIREGLVIQCAQVGRQKPVVSDVLTLRRP